MKCVGEPAVEHLVVDANAFLRNLKLQKMGTNIYTVFEVVSEIRDSATRQRLQVLPYELKFVNPTPEIIKKVGDFSKKTGDYPSLSSVDLKLLAAVYTLESEHCGTGHLKSEPEIQASQKFFRFRPEAINPKDLAGFYIPKKSEINRSESSETPDDEEKDPVDSETVEKLQRLALRDDLEVGSCQSGEEVEEENQRNNQSEDDDEEEVDENEYVTDEESDWISPENLNEALEKMGADFTRLDREQENISVACLTTDFAMQNVLLHMGLKVISVDGMLVKKLKTFILRCYACFKTTSIMTKKFCPSCGNATLDKVSVTVNPEDGSVEYHLSSRKQRTTRGTKYSLPAPRGGKHAWNPVLFEDQPVPHNRMSKKAEGIINPLEPDYLARESPFSVNDVTSRSAVLGIRTIGKRDKIKNPNSGTRGRKRGGKKR